MLLLNSETVATSTTVVCLQAAYCDIYFFPAIERMILLCSHNGSTLSDDPAIVKLVTQSGTLYSKTIVGSPTSEEEMESWSWFTQYLVLCLRTIIPLGCLYLLFWKWSCLKRMGKVILFVGVFVGGFIAAVDFVWLGLTYLVLIVSLFA